MGKNLFAAAVPIIIHHMKRSTAEQSRYHDEERGAHGAEELGGVGGDRVDAAAPGQRVEPRLADHVQVGGDVGGGVLPETVWGWGVHTTIRDIRVYF